MIDMDMMLAIKSYADIAEIARKEMRLYDMLARFGGEEFIVLLPFTVQD